MCGDAGAPRFARSDNSRDVRLEWPVARDRVLALLHGRASGRVSGAPLASSLASLYELAEGKFSRVRVFVDRDEAKVAANAP
jgi:ketosteroid isomerase-like protein